MSPLALCVHDSAASVLHLMSQSGADIIYVDWYVDWPIDMAHARKQLGEVEQNSPKAIHAVSVAGCSIAASINQPGSLNQASAVKIG